MTTPATPASQQAVIDAALVLLERMGLSAAALGITSRNAERGGMPAALARAVRLHWDIEALHNVTMKEDASRLRAGASPQVAASLRNTAVAALRLADFTSTAAGRRWAVRNPLQAIGDLESHINENDQSPRVVARLLIARIDQISIFVTFLPDIGSTFSVRPVPGSESRFDAISAAQHDDIHLSELPGQSPDRIVYSRTGYSASVLLLSGTAFPIGSLRRGSSMRGIFWGRVPRWRVAAAAVAVGIALPVAVEATPALAISAMYGTGSGFCNQVHPATGKDLGANLDNVWACGPAGGDFTVSPFETSDYGFQCTELANRFLWDAHQLAPINDSDAPGENLVGGNFALSVHDQHPSIPLVSSGTTTLPSPGDIISMWKGTGVYGQDGDDSHVAVVTGVAAASSGWNITVMEENSPNDDGGYSTITVSANGATWSYNKGYFTSFDWMHFVPLTIPAEPESLSASPVTGASAVLHWTDSAGNVGQYLTQYKIGNGTWTAGPSAPAGATSVPVGGLKTGTTYTFQVGASNAKGTRWSAYLTVKTVPIPAEPAIGKPAMAARDATISWGEAASNQTQFVTQYKLGSGAWQAGPSVGSGTRSVTIGGLTPGESYTFQVGASNIAGTRWSAYATGSTPQVLASQVTGARVTSTGETAAALAWTNTADNVARFVTQYRVTGTSAWTAGPAVGAGTTSVTVAGLKAGTQYTFQVGAQNSKGTNWGQYFYGTTASTPAPPPPPAGYNTGREVTVVSQATGGDSGHRGPANSYAAGPTHAAGSPIYIVCYVNGQSIAGPYGTETAWDLGDDGYYYSDAWLWTDSNGPVVPACDLKNVTVVSQATGGDSGHTGPGNAYSAGPVRAAGSGVQIACYVSGQSIAGPYGTESIWDLSTDGYYYSDAWLWTDSNGPVVPECP